MSAVTIDDIREEFVYHNLECSLEGYGLVDVDPPAKEKVEAWFDEAIARVQAEAQVEALQDLATAHYLDGPRSTYDTIMGRADRIAREAGIETGEKQ